MLPGPTIIRKCSLCSGAIKEFTLCSGNTAGATFWTDGYYLAPMLPDQPWLIKCPHCQALLWIDELKILAEIDPGETSLRYVKARNYCQPDNKDYSKALVSMILDSKKERYLRIRQWWAWNDCRRRPGEKPPLSKAERLNLERLFHLFNYADQNHRIRMVEILRELSLFDEARQMLAQPFDEEYAEQINFLKKLVSQKNPFVAELEEED